MYNSKFVVIPFDKIPTFPRPLIGTPEYAVTLYNGPVGIFMPVLLATWKGVTYLVGGNRRILSLKEAHKRAAEDGTLGERPWLNNLPAIIYEDVPLAVQDAIAIADNEERSDNPIHAYLTVKAAQERGDWEEVNLIYSYNKAAFKKTMRFEKLHPRLLEAIVIGKMSKTTADEALKLTQPRQEYLIEMVNLKGPEAKITADDVKKAKEAQAKAVLSRQSVIAAIVPQRKDGQMVRSADIAYFLLANDELIEKLKADGVLFEDHRAAYEKLNLQGGKLFRLTKVGG